jgi:hypothetical protein
MRKLSVAFAAAAAILLVSSLAWKADAQTSRGAANIPAQSQDFTPIEKAACGGPGPYCPTGLIRRCGPLGRCWCAPCGGYYGGGPYYRGYGWRGRYWGWRHRRW